MDLKDALLDFWYAKQERPNKDDFIKDRLQWEEAAQWIHNQQDEMFSHDCIKDAVKNLDKAGLLAQETKKQAMEVKQQRADNMKAFGTTEGADGIQAAADRWATQINKDNNRGLSRQYMDYIAGNVWRQRSLKYLNDCCRVRGRDQWKCQLCGAIHSHRSTINVHHNSRHTLDGHEPDVELLGCCAGLCHNFADTALRINRGETDKARANDYVRPLFQ